MAGLLVAGGRVTGRFVVGADPGAARARIEQHVQRRFSTSAEDLRATAVRLRESGIGIPDAIGDGAAAVLFDAVTAALGQNPDDTKALSVYAASGQAVAWVGRPSELPPAQLLNGTGWLLIQSPLGLRLAYLEPLFGTDGTRAGTVVAEEALDVSAPVPGDSAEYVLSDRGTPVALELSSPSGPSSGAAQFDVVDPGGRRLLTGTVNDADLRRTARRWARAGDSLALIVLAASLLLFCGPLLAARTGVSKLSTHLWAIVSCAGAVLVARGLLRLASPADYVSAEVFSGSVYASPLAAPLLSSPFDFLASALAVLALVLTALAATESARVFRTVSRRAILTWGRASIFVATQVVAGVVLLITFRLQRALIEDTIANTALDLAQFSLHPWSTARLAMQLGLVCWHVAAIGLGLVAVRATLLPWRLTAGHHGVRVAMVLAWVAPWTLQLALTAQYSLVPQIVPLLVTVGIALLAPRLMARFRHGSQAFRLLLLTLGILVPTLAGYPLVMADVTRAKRDLVETRYAPQALNQRQTIQRALQDSLAQLDTSATLPDLVTTPLSADGAGLASDRAFQLWRDTGLGDYPITSSVELFDRDGALLSRFAFNLPDDLATAPQADEDRCTWSLYEEVAPFFAEERRVLHAGRAICVPDGTGVPRPVGAIVVHAMLDYANLPFIASQNPYVELLRPADAGRDETRAGQDVQYAVYGWSGRPVYSSADAAWPLDGSALATIATTRAPRWLTLARGTAQFDVFLTNDRGGIYALGFPRLSALGHLVNLAELTVLACLAYLLMAGAAASLDLVRGQPASGRALLREVRTSFYRKLFLAFVAAAVIPVVALAVLARNYMASQLQTSIQAEAVRTVGAARRVVEDLVLPRTSGGGAPVDDNLMVWVSRLIDQDVNVFRGSRLLATSERNLYASGLLTLRTPAEVYRTLNVTKDATAVITDRVGSFAYLVAAAPLTTRESDGMLTVPLTLRQQEVDAQVDALNRLVLLGAVLFIVLGAGIGYSMAERIADPVSRLTRATRRLARGDLDARSLVTSSDELGRLVDAFNGMAANLARQRAELERTHRLEAWAEMARQVAHEIKNPLTPIQLNAEHLRRIHADRGQPLHPVLEECVANILTQVRLLRTIASEFSSFAATPSVRREPVPLAPLVHGILEPYQRSLEGVVRLDEDVPEDLPPAIVDRTLVARAITNVIENALHAMPGGGRLSVRALIVNAAIEVAIADTGVGMDAEALARAFEPYFSTKVSGTGLGLPIAKRNVELSGGAVRVESAPGAGTTVTLTLPLR